jgi:23S rRNA pseudouridine2604 synthase
MTRPTLKLPPRARDAASPKPPTARQRRALHGRKPAAVASTAPSGTPSGARAATPSRTAPRERIPRSLAAASTPTTAPIAPRQRPPLNPDNPRLSKRMSELGLCSRREADAWIENGWVKVDGAVVSTLGTRVAPDARIEIDSAARRHQHEQVTILLNKPVGYVSGQAEDGYRPASVLIRPENRWAEDRAPVTFKPSHLRGLAPAGRLDIDSTGLIVFTQDGRVARRLIGHDSEVEKEYLVRVEGTLSPEGLQRLQHGLELDGVKLKPAKVSWQNEHQLRFVLREGRKRQVRRMCELVGLKVTGLKRVRTGSVVLGKLPAGQWRYLRPDEKF